MRVADDVRLLDAVADEALRDANTRQVGMKKAANDCEVAWEAVRALTRAVAWDANVRQALVRCLRDRDGLCLSYHFQSTLMWA